MLAQTYKSDKLQGVTWTQPKLDGIRTLLNIRMGISRNGNAFATIQHIQDAAEDVFRMMPSLVLDGELYNHIHKDDFNAIVSLVKNQSPTAEELKTLRSTLEFHVFDCFVEGWDWRFGERNELLRSLPVFSHADSPLKLVPTRKLTTLELVDAIYASDLEAGYEGTMYRGDGLYMQCGPTQRRSPSLLKRKPTHTAEGTIVSVHEGQGKCSGMVGYFTIFWDGKTFDVSAGKLTFPKRQELWQYRDHLPGRALTFRYGRLTPAGIPRWGRAVAVRDYE
jgi:ATP-dependent DNA ligase